MCLYYSNTELQWQGTTILWKCMEGGESPSQSSLDNSWWKNRTAMMAAFNADAGCQIGLEAVAAGWLADVVHRSRIGGRGSLNPQRPTRGPSHRSPLALATVPVWGHKECTYWISGSQMMPEFYCEWLWGSIQLRRGEALRSVLFATSFANCRNNGEVNYWASGAPCTDIALCTSKTPCMQKYIQECVQHCKRKWECWCEVYWRSVQHLTQLSDGRAHFPKWEE